MTEEDTENKFEEYFAWLPNCDPATSFCTMEVQPRPQYPPDDMKEPPRDYPEINLADKNWRAHTLASKQLIPAGYTYFGQLLGHDLGRSIRIEHVPYSDKKGQIGPDSDKPPVRYNLIENPLTLETIYGPGPAMLPHLFDPKTYLFRVDKNFVISRIHVLSDPSIRALYDNRNRDTTFLHRLATIWMRYHNQIAIAILPELETSEAVQPPLKERVYAEARARVLATWHHLIVNDFLPKFIDPVVMKMPVASMKRFAVLDETSLLHGLFRAFHCLPRKKYQFPVSHFLSEILLTHRNRDEKESSGWPLDWKLFFTDHPVGTKTGMCASFSPRLTSSEGVPISQLDLITNNETDPLQLSAPTIRQIIGQMSSTSANQLDPENLADAFNKKVANAMKVSITGAEILRSPLYVVLMLEAQLYGREGRFGPLGSILLRRSIEHAISKVRTDMLVQTGVSHRPPDTIIELINNV